MILTLYNIGPHVIHTVLSICIIEYNTYILILVQYSFSQNKEALSYC